jgi:putative pyruvate formate lyase activating enzyme
VADRDNGGRQVDWPAYLALLDSGELQRRVERAYRMLESCRICPQMCAVNRLQDERGGLCRTGRLAVVSSYNLHFGEEPPLVGRGGSGTIFFTHCNMKCQYCQNYEISHLGAGTEVEVEDLAAMMLHLQQSGAQNINFVSPTHIVPQILAAVAIAAQAGLRLPLVYNTGGYDALPTLRLLDGVVDIYMPDAKYADAAVAEKYSLVKQYPKVNRLALKEMYRQVGDLELDARGVARRGLIVRHLVLPEGLAGTAETMRFLAEEISVDTYVNVMAQYRPCYRAMEHPALRRSLTREEYQEAVELTRSMGLHRLAR